ncbi:hypothetical protein E3P77_01138 [Wallemia ichthyophaga]|nr:hypothetical protein E3P77_01138 [Wallemia ichthyophaga]
METLFHNDSTPISRREGIRRKSSASNLLSTLGTSASSSRSRQNSDPVENIAISSSDADGIDLLNDTMVKRIKSFKLMRMAYEGRLHWFNTVLLSRSDLEPSLDDYKMSKRTHKFLVLGLSLSYHLDNNQPADFIKSLAATLSEYDNLDDDNYKPKIKNLFKTKHSKRPTANSDTSDITYLTNPNIPFQLSYFEVIYSLCDILVQIYCKISSTLGSNVVNNSSNPYSTSPAMSSPLSPLSTVNSHSHGPNTANTFSLSPTNTASSPPPQLPQLSTQPSSASLQSQASAQTSQHNSLTAPMSMSMSMSFSDTHPQSIKRNNSTSTLKSDLPIHSLDLIWKADGKLKKILMTLTKDLNEIARQAIKDELITLDPSVTSGQSGQQQQNHQQQHQQQYQPQHQPNHHQQAYQQNFTSQPLSPVAESIRNAI